MSELTQHIRVLYVDDQESNLDAFVAAYRRNFTIFTAGSGSLAKEILAREEIHVVMTDQRMPEVSGIQLLQFLVQNHPNISRILLTAYSDIESLESAVNKGRIFRYLKKPWKDAEIMESIVGAYEDYLIRKGRSEMR